jgi:hypothetical protein
MPPRAVLNAVYAHMVRDMDPKQRRNFNAELYGWKADNDAGMRALNSGGES